jgi:RNA 2',3'-cyclic 3'-phosphodiesterase
VRVFVGLELDAELSEALGQGIERVRAHAPEARWIEPANLHVTLVFLGHVADERMAEIDDALRRGASRHDGLSLSIQGAGAFGARRRPRVLFATLAGDVDRLAALAADLAGELAGIRRPEDRPYAGHVTLARARDPKGDAALAACAEDLAGVTFGRVNVRDVVLFRSDLSPQGARYTPIASFPLRGFGADKARILH